MQQLRHAARQGTAAGQGTAGQRAEDVKSGRVTGHAQLHHQAAECPASAAKSLWRDTSVQLGGVPDISYMYTAIFNIPYNNPNFPGFYPSKVYIVQDSEFA